MRELLDAERHLHARLDECPGDRDSRRLLADVYRDLGDDAAVRQQGWLVAIGKYPLRCRFTRGDEQRWDWFPGFIFDAPQPFCVSEELYILLAGGGTYAARRDAEDDLWRVARERLPKPVARHADDAAAGRLLVAAEKFGTGRLLRGGS